MLFISFSSCFLLLLSSAIISSNGLDPGQIKPCFERYVGYKLADAQPFHSEWRITSEEFCLEFCARSSSRCLSIVFDKANHVCHYFSVNGVKSDGVVKQRNFVYLQTTSNECLEKLLSIERPTSNEPINGVKSAEYLDQSNQQLILEGDAIPVFGHKQQQNQSMSDILERIDGELQMQLQQLQKKKAAQLFGAFRATKKQTNMDMTDEQREIRRHPRINANQHEATGTGKEEQGEARRDFGPSFLKEAAVPKRMTSSDNEEEEKANCEPGANVIWLTVENARFNGSTLKLGAVASPAECIKRVADMTAEGHHNFNAFSYLDVEKTCEFVHSGDEFPAFIGDGSLLSSPSADFSRRAFRRFCYPENLSPFNRCSDFLAFTDYEMKTEPREVFDGLPLGAEGTSACIELCVLSSEFQCLSGHFAATKGVCHLFDAHSLSNPGAFQSHREPDQLYFENGCIFIDGQNSEAKYPTLAQRT